MKRILSGCLALSMVLGPVRPAMPASTDSPTIDRMLASEFSRYVRVAAGSDLMERSTFESAIHLAEVVTELQPDDPASWTLMLDVATIAEAEAHRSEAIRNLVRLDPTNERARLLRLQDVIESYQTAEERIRAYDTFLSEENVQAIGAGVASRLAYDYAIMLRQVGDLEGFARWLAASVAIDESNHTAAALAAGYFALNIDDPYAEAELLVDVLLADPTDYGTMLTLAQRLLENGAYTSATRLYRIAMSGRESINRFLSPGTFADMLIAMWGAGRIDAAMTALDQRQHLSDVMAQNRALIDDPSLTRVDVAHGREDDPGNPNDYVVEKVRGTLSTDVSLVRSAIFADRSEAEQQRAYEQLRSSYRMAIERLEADDATTATALAAKWVEYAFALLWFGDDTATAQSALEEADVLSPLSDLARRRYDALIALRSGELESALALTGAVAENDDNLAMLIRAEALQGLGREKSAAQLWFELARAEPGTLIGVWSDVRLRRALGQNLPIDETAQRLEELIASIPRTFDGFPARPETFCTLQIESVQPSYDAFDPVFVRLRIMNHYGRAFAIDPNGPIRPTVAIVPDGRMTNYRGAEQQRPIIVDIGRRLRVGPYESYDVIVDLRTYPIGQHLNEFSLAGAVVRVRGFTNFAGLPPKGEVVEGLLGVRTESNRFRIEGQRVDDAWVDATVMRIQDRTQETPEILKDIAFLAQVARLGQQTDVVTAPNVTPERVDICTDVVIDAFPTLSPTAQAWLLMTLPPNAIFKPVLDAAAEVDDPKVQIAYLLRGLQSAADPVLARCERSDVDSVRTIATMLRRSFERRGDVIEAIPDDEPALDGRP